MISDRHKLECRGVSSIERRKHARYSSTAAAVVVEMRSAARIQGRLSDLARGGCNTDSIRPLGVGSEVKMRIVNGNRTAIAQAKLVFAAAGMGMGLMFTAIEPAQLLVLAKNGWRSCAGRPTSHRAWKKRAQAEELLPRARRVTSKTTC